MRDEGWTAVYEHWRARNDALVIDETGFRETQDTVGLEPYEDLSPRGAGVSRRYPTAVETKAGISAREPTPGLIALTVQASRRWLLRLGRHFSRRLSHFQIAAGSGWRRRHQTQAQYDHRQRRFLKRGLAD